MDLKAEIYAEANNLGFLLIGAASPQTPPHYSKYEAWVDHGFHGEMAYLANDRSRQRRFDPRQILPEAASLLSLALPYEAPLRERALPNAGGTGQIAAYAWGQDYHEVIPPRLAQLVERVEVRIGRPIRWRGYTDTGPILERDWALLAGSGWIGKNTCLIHPRHGSFFFLAEILWDVDLEPESPLKTDYCGTCQRCIDACPTGCILPDRTLDAVRCISYQTIENKGAIPEEIRPHMGNWVFGCDICQQVCPWNGRFAELHGDPGLASASNEHPAPILVDELSLTPQQFNRKFRHSPVLRTRRRGYLRNIAIALGNQRDPAALPGLARAITNEPEPLVRAHLAWAIGQIRGSAARHALEQARAVEQDETVLWEIRSALAGLG